MHKVVIVDQEVLDIDEAVVIYAESQDIMRVNVPIKKVIMI